jgi:hypothetical protein
LRTKARIRYRKHDRIQRQAGDRIKETLSGDQRRILALSVEEYQPTEIARELALPEAYVVHFMTGLVQRLSHEGLIPSPDWRNAVLWARAEGLLPE